MRQIPFRPKIPVRNCFAAVALGVFLVFFLPSSNFAATLKEYFQNIKKARDSTLELLYSDSEDMSLKEYSQLERENLAVIRRFLPASEKVVWRGGEIETNNQWLVEELNRYEKEADNSPHRKMILTAIYERLNAIEQKIREIENADAANRSKDEDKQKLAEILRREEYQKPEKQENLLQKFYRKLLKWLADLFPKSNLPETFGGFQSLSLILQLLLYVFVFGAIGFLAYRFAPSFLKRFRRSEKAEKKNRVILGERLSADETAENLFRQAERLAREGNSRGAIRKGYIAFLFELSERKIIGLARHKTNRDYLRDVKGKRELYKNMNGLTSNFERCWYGFETADQNDWEEFRQNYKKAFETI